MTATVHLNRKSSLVYCIRKFGVFIDGQKVGSIANGSSERFQLAPGRHSIYIKVSWCKSQEIDFEVRSGEIKELQCGTPLGIAYFATVFGLVFGIQIARSVAPKLIVSLIAIIVGVVFIVMSFKPGSYVYLKESTALRTI